MKISEDIKPVTYLKSKSPEMLDKINRDRRPIIITQNGIPRGVIQDPESYENMRQALGIMKLMSQGEKDVQENKATEQEKVFKKLKSKLTKSGN